MKYTVVIRTLGKAGNKYQQLLDSLDKQTIKPTKILVYIAENFKIPKESIGWEQYIFVKKGMVSQRALKYDEVDTDYILFIDDDLLFPNNAVEKMFTILEQENGDIVSPDIFPNAKRSLFYEFLMTVSGRMIARRNDKYWGYKVMRNSGYSYNKRPVKECYWSQTNAGACFLCKKEDFLKIHFEEEIWMDNMKYALGEDQVMYYKMFLLGLKQLTWFNSGIKHLDAGTTMKNVEKEKTLIFSDIYFKIVFWHRFIYLPDHLFMSRIWSLICLVYTFCITLLISLIKLNFKFFIIKFKAIKDAILFIRSEEYRNLPLIKKVI